MILQQLEHDAETIIGTLPPPMYTTREARWVVHLTPDGLPMGPPEPLSGGGRQDHGKQMLLPFKKRTAPMHPLLLADKSSYTWGHPSDEKDAQNNHRSYLELLRRCWTETGHSGVGAILTFLENRDKQLQRLRESPDPDYSLERSELGDSLLLRLPPSMAVEDITIFCVAGEYPTDDPEIQAFWAQSVAGSRGDHPNTQCLVCGEHRQIVDRLPIPIKGIPRSQAGGAELVSANSDAFESFGLKAARTSPICRDCGERFGKAANALLQDDKKHLKIGPVAYLFWTTSNAFDVCALFRDPQPEDVKALLESGFGGLPVSLEDDTPFYATALTAAKSRAIVRSWLHTTVQDARKSLEKWFRLQRIVSTQGDLGRPLSIFQLSASLYRDAQGIEARAPELLLHAALEGRPLPAWLLQQAVRRNDAERKVTYPRAALIKAVLCTQDEGDIERMEKIDCTKRDPAYLCGRLLAELEAVQRVAIDPRATLVDRYYGTASSAPATVFGTLLRGAQPHLAKLRKERPGACRALQSRLEEILEGLDGFPPVLTLPEQALFALGYYHQRAEDRRAAAEATARKRSADDASLQIGDVTTVTTERHTNNESTV